jgi:hypothetical protein
LPFVSVRRGGPLGQPNRKGRTPDRSFQWLGSPLRPAGPDVNAVPCAPGDTSSRRAKQPAGFKPRLSSACA